jgi:hypothetical protein
VPITAPRVCEPQLPEALDVSSWNFKENTVRREFAQLTLTLSLLAAMAIAGASFLL